MADEKKATVHVAEEGGVVAQAEYFDRLAKRSARRHRLVTLATLFLCGLCYYLLFGGTLPDWPHELQPISLMSDGSQGHWSPWSWLTHALPLGHRPACAGHRGGKPTHDPFNDSASEYGYLSYLSRSVGLRKPLHHALSVNGIACIDASRGGIGFGNKVDVSIASSPSQLEGSNLEQMYESLFLSIPSAEGARAANLLYANHTHVSSSKGDRNTAIYTAKRWGELLGVQMPEKIGKIVYEAGSTESQQAVKGSDGESGHYHHHHRRRRHFGTESSKNSKGNKGKHGKPHYGPTTDPRVWIDTYHVWINTPLNQSLVLTASPSAAVPHPEPIFTASLTEDQVGDDPNIPAEVSPTYHGYSKSGRVDYAQVVYANLGRKEDYDALDAAGISLQGRVALVRYGGPFRGLKVRGAEMRGAVACLIYTDPAEDGAVTLANGYAAYPDGPARQPSSIQRGSVQALSFYPGDPSTPGRPSYKNATRLLPHEADSLPAIPSLPLSYRDAAPLLRALQHHGRPASAMGTGRDWDGAVPGIAGEYWTGPAPDVVVSLQNFGELAVRKIWNAYAVIPGHVADEVVVLGNHRDAWTFGAADPSSGSAVFEQIVNGLGAMVSKGWKPLRTIMIASWDAEEFGLVGSTEHAEDFPDWIKANVIMYLNLDIAVSGSAFGGRASPSLVDLLADVAAKVDDPDSPLGANGKLAFPRGHALGSGSDFTSYLQHLGIASADMSFSRRETDPVYHYHSQYDSFNWMDNFGDPSWKRHVAVAKVFGLAALRSASNLFVPINTTAYAEELGRYVQNVERLPAAPAAATSAAADFGPLRRGVKRIVDAAAALDATKERLAARLRKALKHAHEADEIEDQLPAEKHNNHDGSRPDRRRGRREARQELRRIITEIRRVNAKATKFEQGFISEDGLVGRPWYKHLGVAPGRYLGYGATTLPGVTESITLDGGKGTQEEIDRLAAHLEKIAARLLVAGAQ
ncbi:Zn-dependent exopeptidase [Tilletiaria anomala UBC 951]|uniref:Zn-dependent exopeptidase n=1 Tax=Tilletiaria anomala (strain ATCC 24038 / CBS 436.72 / UBC 951) TaxID=1037660 RepID=A0A066VHP4_TILAU|nr:Zn-dependent exopeptidase [Tilletiaria anomala UBC 951]KDN41247.1 Zn-dependent exopeptidase [Tilletiaria anomala UBC 951]